MKKCSMCKALKELIYFHKNKSSKDGLNNCCKNCRRIAPLNKENKIKTCSKCKKDFDISLFYKNHAYCKSCVKIWKEEKAINKVLVCSRCCESKKYNSFHSGKNYSYTVSSICLECKSKSLKTKEYFRSKRREYEAKHRQDPKYKLHNNISRSIRYGFKIGGGKKAGPVNKILLYSINDLKAHLESLFEPWMSWNNFGKYIVKKWNDNDFSTWTWQIDHIIPQSDLLYDSMDHPNFKKCWSLENLRPLSSKQNLIDGTRRTRHKSGV